MSDSKYNKQTDRTINGGVPRRSIRDGVDEIMKSKRGIEDDE